MSFLSKMAKLDSTLQRGLDNGFARVFRGAVVPAEIDELIKQEAEDNLVRTFDDRWEAPNAFTIGVSPKDFVNLSAAHPGLPSQAADRISRFYRNQNWLPAGAVTVVVERSQSLHTGQLSCHSTSTAQAAGGSRFEAGASGASGATLETQAPPARLPAPDPTRYQEDVNQPMVTPEPTPHKPASTASTEFMQAQPQQQAAPLAAPGPTVTLLLQDGSSRTYMVQEGSNIIGRGNDVDLRLPDTGVSRQHAEITWDGESAILTDLHSTNGTLVNDMAVENWLLADGDVITVGHSFIEVRITGL